MTYWLGLISLIIETDINENIFGKKDSYFQLNYWISNSLKHVTDVQLVENWIFTNHNPVYYH